MEIMPDQLSPSCESIHDSGALPDHINVIQKADNSTFGWNITNFNKFLSLSCQFHCSFSMVDHFETFNCHSTCRTKKAMPYVTVNFSKQLDESGQPGLMSRIRSFVLFIL